MRSSAVVVLLVGALLAGGVILQTTQAEEQNDKPAKLVRKGSTAVQQDAGPVEPARREDDASPPVIFEQEPDPDHAHDHAADVLDEELLNVVQRLLHGEAAQEEAGAQEQHPLLRIGRHMRDAEDRIAQIDAGRETQTIQTSIVKDLDALIDQLKQQASTCSNCNGAGCAQCQQLGSKRGQQPGKPNNSGKPGNNARANTAATQAGKTTPQQVAGERRAELIKNIWGHLPMRMREKLEQLSNETPLVKYESLIERYFEALAERSNRPSS